MGRQALLRSAPLCSLEGLQSGRRRAFLSQDKIPSAVGRPSASVLYSKALSPKRVPNQQHMPSGTVVGDFYVVAGSASTIAVLKEEEGPAWLESMGLPCCWVAVDGKTGGSLAQVRDWYTQARVGARDVRRAAFKSTIKSWVPEPATVALAAVGLVGLLAAVRRRA